MILVMISPVICHFNFSLKFFIKIWQHQKNIFIFASQNKNMLRIQLHIESVNWFSPKGDYAGRGACSAAELS